MPLPALAAVLLKIGAPLLANAALAKGKEWVEEKTGVKLDAAADTLGAGLSPEAAASLRQYELEHEEELARIRLEDNRIAAELERDYLRDRQDARARDTEFIKQGRKNERGDVLAYLAIGGLLAAGGAVFFAPDLSAGQRELLIYILGALTVLVKDVYSFEFGTSKDAAKMGNAMTKWLDEEGK